MNAGQSYNIIGDATRHNFKKEIAVVMDEIFEVESHKSDERNLPTIVADNYARYIEGVKTGEFEYSRFTSWENVIRDFKRFLRMNVDNYITINEKKGTEYKGMVCIPKLYHVKKPLGEKVIDQLYIMLEEDTDLKEYVRNQGYEPLFGIIHSRKQKDPAMVILIAKPKKTQE